MALHEVLNASRHHGERDYLSDEAPALLRQCSTPLGITASGTWVRVWGQVQSWGCAQRLSASRRAGQWRALVAIMRAELCSTPLGITASGTTTSRSVFQSALECSTPLGITASGTVEALEVP